MSSLVNASLNATAATALASQLTSPKTKAALNAAKQQIVIVKAHTNHSAVVSQESNQTLGRREVLGLSSALLFNLPFAQSAFAAAPKGYKTFTDSVDNYAFCYPFGWQEVAIKGLDIVFKDVIEPLESVSINIIKTDKADLSEFGTPEEVADALVSKVLTNPNQKTKILITKERETNGKKYYTFEFLAESSNYTRHAVATVSVGNGKFYTLVTGANERRWNKMNEKLQLIADSFINL